MIAANGAERTRLLSRLESGRFAVIEGMMYDEWVLNRLPNAQFEYYRTAFDCISALKNDNVDAFPYDDSMLKYMIGNASESFAFIYDEGFGVADYGFAVNTNRPDLKKAIDEAIADIRAEGSYDDMVTRWFPRTGATGIMPQLKLTGKNGKLRFGTSTIDRPFTFIVGDGVITGFDIELATRICAKLETELEISAITFSELIPAVVSEEVDMIGAALAITEERCRSVLFSEPYFQAKVALLVKSDFASI